MVAAMAYEVCTPVFAGPFDLLLHLILRDRIDLYAVSIAEIVDAYLAELERMEGCDLEVTTEFLLIAATLVELKARRLLPDDIEVELDEELGRWERRDLLLARLVECKTFREVAGVLRHFIEGAALSRPRSAGVPEEWLEQLAPPAISIDPEALAAAYRRAVAPRPAPRVDVSHITPITATVSAAVAELVSVLPGHGRITFRRLTEGIADRVEVIVRFLAVLELVKQGLADIRQPAASDDITVLWTGPAELEAAAVAVDAYEG